MSGWGVIWVGGVGCGLWGWWVRVVGRVRVSLMYVELLGVGHPFRQWKTWRIAGTGLSLSGYSRANDKTFFHVPELRCALDAGLVEGRQVDTVLLTHTHHDHVKDLDFLAAKAGTDVYLPAASLSYAEDFLTASAKLNHGADYDPGLAGHALHGVGQGDEFRFGKRHHVRVVECQHKVPCVGYAVSEVGKALVPEFAALRESLPGKEFGALMARKRAEGVAVEQEVLRPLFVFMGDTHPDVFGRNPWLFEFPVVITECTYLYDSELERASRVGHTVWSQLRPYVVEHPGTVFVLTHFSLRYSDREVVEFFKENGAANTVVWAHPESQLREQHQQR